MLVLMLAADLFSRTALEGLEASTSAEADGDIDDKVSVNGVSVLEVKS